MAALGVCCCSRAFSLVWVSGHCAVRLAPQSCPTLCDHMDGSPPGSFVRGDSPGKNTEVVATPSSRGLFSCCRAWALGHEGFKLWSTGLFAPWHVESFQTRDWTRVWLAGGFLTAGPRRKSLNRFCKCYVCVFVYIYSHTTPSNTQAPTNQFWWTLC